MLIKNAAIDHQVDRYLKEFWESGEITFEFQTDEYVAFSELTKSFRQAIRAPGFSRDSWTHRARDNGLFENTKASHVFGFTLLVWDASTRISARRHGDMVHLEVKKDT